MAATPRGRGQNNCHATSIHSGDYHGGQRRQYNRPIPNFMDLDCFTPSPGQTWPPPDNEFGVGPGVNPPEYYHSPYTGLPPNQHGRGGLPANQYQTWPLSVGPGVNPPPYYHSPYPDLPPNQRGRGGLPPNQRGRGDLRPNQPGRGGFGGNSQQGRGRKRQTQNQNRGAEPKEKKVKSDENEDPAFWCDPCGRGFKDQHSWDGHTETHTTCGIDDCPYYAAAKLVKLHQELQHKTGLAGKIWTLESKASIDKWREERRKKFPTKGKIVEKDSEQAGRIERGELLETKNFGKFNRRGRGRGHRGRHHHNNSDGSRGRDLHHKDTVAVTDVAGVTHVAQISKVTQVAQVAQVSQVAQVVVVDKVKREPVVIEAEKKEKIPDGDPLALFESDKSDEGETEVTTQKEKPSGIGGALGALMCEYESESENESEGVNAQPAHVVINEAENDEFSLVVDKPEKDEDISGQNRPGIADNSPPILSSDVIVKSDDVTQNVVSGTDNVTSSDVGPKSDDVIENGAITTQRVIRQDCDVIKTSVTSSESAIDVASTSDSQNCLPQENTGSLGKGSRDESRGQRSRDKSRDGRGRGRSRGKRRGKGDYRGETERRSTLLEKLLAPDIRHERNVVLQCIRHICKNNFYGLAGAAPPSDEVVELA